MLYTSGMLSLAFALLCQQDLVDQYLGEPNRLKRADIASRLKTAAFEAVDKAIRDGGSWPATKDAGQILHRRSRTDVGGVDFDYHLYVPEAYDPAKPHRLLISLHGWGGRGEPLVDLWLELAKKEGDLFVLAPTSRKHIWAGPRAGHSHVLTALREVQRDFHISPDHVTLDGMSMGARGAFDIGAYYCDRFAAIAPRSALPRTAAEGAGAAAEGAGAARSFEARLIDNYRALPVYWMFGSRDPAFVKGTTEAVCAQFREGKYDAALRELDGGHEWFPEESPAVLDWMRKRPRNPYPAEIAYLTLEKVFRRAYWIEIDQFAGGRTIAREHHSMAGDLHETRHEFADPALVRGKLVKEANRVELRTENVRALTVRLHDRMLDLSKPVEIRLNGRTVWSKAVPRSVATMLETAREYDRSMFFSAQLELKVSP